MALKDLLKPPSDDKIYKKLIEREPTLKNLFIIFEISKGYLLKKLINDSNIEESKRELWKELISNHKKYINETFIL